MWNKEAVKAVLRSRKFAVAVSSVLSAGAGATGSYFLLSKRLEAKYAAISEKEIQDAREYYDRLEKLEKVGEYADPVALAQDLIDQETTARLQNESMIEAAQELSESAGYVSYDKLPAQSEKDKVEAVVSIKNTLRDNFTPDAYDLDDEEDKKSRGKPYIVESERYFDNEDDYVLLTITYYVEDDVLVDDQDRPIDNAEPVIGSENLRFGCGTDDKNAVYIFNDRFKAGYEVIRNAGSYAREVHGYIQHSDRPRVRKFRSYDDN